MACNHPFSALKLSECNLAQRGAVTLRLCCTACRVTLTKEFLISTPAPPELVKRTSPVIAAVSMGEFARQHAS